MEWIWTTISALVLVLLPFLYLLKKFIALDKNKKLPPGPKGLSILCHLNPFGKNAHKDFYHLAQKYGPIVYMRLGFVRTVVVSSPAGAELFLKTHDLVFANRPRFEGFKLMAYDKDIVSAQYSDYWRNMRKMCTLELLSNLKTNQFQAMRQAELGLLIKTLKRDAEKGETVDISAKLWELTMDMMCLMTFGKKYGDKEFNLTGFQAAIREALELATVPNVGDFCPYIGVFDLQGLRRKLKKLSSIIDEFFEKIIDDHVQRKEENKKSDNCQDFVDTLMNIMDSGEAGFEFDRRNVKAMLLDMLVPGMDNTASSVDWALSELIKHPTAMKKLQTELDSVVGKDSPVNESHLDNLKYLDCVIKETLRLHPIAPLLVPHESTQDSIVDGFYIPKKTLVIVNAWAIGRDPRAWPNPEKFLPERFIGSNVDLLGKDFQLIPFGSGRRICPGIQLGLRVVKLILAQLVHCFDWELYDNMLCSDLDMDECFGLATVRANHLKVIPSYRLQE